MRVYPFLMLRCGLVETLLKASIALAEKHVYALEPRTGGTVITQDELLHLALEEGLTRDQVITALSALRENNERYLSRRRRHGHRTETDAFLGQREGALALSVAWLRQQQKGEGPKGLSDQQDPHHFTASSPTSSSDVTIDEVGDDG